MPPVDKQTGRSQPILRVRTGCLTCRGRKKKCDEERPVCRGCRRNHLTCTWPTARAKDQRRTHAIREDERRNSSSSSPAERTSDEDDAVAHLEANQTPQTAPQELHLREHDFLDPLAIPIGAEFADPSLPDVLMNPVTEISDPFAHEGFAMSLMPRNLSILPQLGHDSFDLLSHYLSKTANSMGNGSTEVNPFVVQLVPLAFSSDLILQLMLTQSAAHRAVTGPESAQSVANKYYAKSLRLFRDKVNNFINGSDVDALVLATGALVMCFTETAKGDTHGAMFDHLSAANSILINLMEKPHSVFTKALSDFLVEYYTYTATVSMISIDARYSTQMLLTSETEQQAQALVKSHYIGHLCGCWLELLLLIPRIFELGRRTLLAHDNQAFGVASSDDWIEFSLIHHEILSFFPAPSVRFETSHAGFIYQQAVFLYLLTTLESFHSEPVGKYSNAVENAVTEAMEHLGRIQPTSRINTSLCWPLAIIGSCTADEMVQSTIRQRLQTMAETITLGNMKQTLILLEHIWTLPLAERGPWRICTAMQEHELWISFA